jgi:hypothetical protein
MFRHLTLIALVALLAACSTQGAGETDPAGGSETAEASSASAGVSSDASTGTDPSGEASAACADAFATIDASGVESLSDLVEVDGLDATISECESVADWVAGAGQLVEDVNPSTAELLLGIACDRPGLSNTDVCEEIASS